MKSIYSIYKSLKDRVEKILPINQQKSPIFSEDYDFTISPYAWLHNFVFVIEKYLNSKVSHRKYEIIYSSKYSTQHLDEKSLKNLYQLETLLKKGDVSVNNPSYGFLPSSSKSYFKDCDFNVDFTNQFYGIKHFHLCSDDRSRDELLYFVIYEGEIYFLTIGGHNKLYNQENIEILVREFPQIASKVGIHKMPDMPIGEPFQYSVDQLKKQWVRGSNSSFIIDGDYYISIHLQTTSHLNTQIKQISDNIFFQFEKQLNSFKTKLGEDNKIISLSYEDNSLVKNGVVLIGDEISKNAEEINIPYLQKLEEVDDFLALN